MAKRGGTLAAIKAKPNARGKTSHLPMICDTKGCDNDFLLAYGSFENRHRKCEVHAPQLKAVAENVLFHKLGLL